ncbi:MAG: hypothetical protein ACLFTK_09165 [Anaerolineales bacterium]
MPTSAPIMPRRLDLLGLALLAIVARLVPGQRIVDDAFITFRYSRNLAEGHGFVYNLGERVLGTTTPLYTAIMTLAGSLANGDYPAAAVLVNALAGGVEVVLVALIAQHLTQQRAIALWLGAAWAVAPFAVTFAIGGMETSVHNVMMLGAWYAYLSARPRALGVLCALGVLTRPDALLWALPILAHQLWRAWRERPATQPSPRAWLPWQTWASGLIVYLPWFFFSWAYFGNPIPQTITAKANVYFLRPTQAFEIFLQRYAMPFEEGLALGTPGIVVGLFLYPTLALIGLRAATAQEKRALPLMVFPWLYMLVYSIANPLIFRWYQTPPLPAYYLAIGAGVWALLVLLPRPAWRQYAVAVLAAFTLGFLLNGWTLSPDHGPDRPAPRMAFHELELHYARMAQTLVQEYGVTPDSWVAAGDIGAVGYYSRARIFDTVGLVTQGNAPYYEDRDSLDDQRLPEMNYVIPSNLLLDAEPDYMILMEGFIRNTLLQEPDFFAQYQQVGIIETDYYGTGMLAFQHAPTSREREP